MTEKAVMQQNNGGVATAPETATENVRTVRPAVDIFTKDESIVLVADVPGVTGENLSINIEDRVLTIDAKAHIGEERNAIYSEYELTNYHRQFELSDHVDQDKIEANLKNGVLTLNMPKVEKARPRSIQVNAS